MMTTYEAALEWLIFGIPLALAVLLVVAIVWIIRKKRLNLSPGNKANSSRSYGLGIISIGIGTLGLGTVLVLTPLFTYGFLFGCIGIILAIAEFVTNRSIRSVSAIIGLIICVFAIVAAVAIGRAWSS